VAKQEERLIDNGNIGALYRYANNIFSFKSAIGALKNSKSTITNDSSINPQQGTLKKLHFRAPGVFADPKSANVVGCCYFQTIANHFVFQ